MALTNQDLIEYFKQRMVELYDNNTLDSYGVRTCNSMSMIYEMKEILEGWIACSVKRGETVARCVDECVMMLKNDDCMVFSFYDKTKLLEKFEEYKKSVIKITDSRTKREEDNDEARFILHIVTSCIAVNDTAYLPALISSVHDDLFTENAYQDEDFSPTLKRLDDKLSLMATELLRRGYSKTFLYFFFKSIKVNEKHIPFTEAFVQLQQRFCAVQQYQYSVIIRLNFPKEPVPAMENMYNEVLAQYMEVMRGSLKGTFKKAYGRRFYMVEEQAVDSCSALQKARLRLSKALDRNDMGSVVISNQGVVAYLKNGNRILRSEWYYAEGGLLNHAEKLSPIMHEIDGSDALSRDIKDRLNTALRHLRVGDDQAEIEQRFLNYWIGLEFIFSTPRSGNSTFSRLMEKFPMIKTLYYLKRNVSDLDTRLREKGLLGEAESFGYFSEHKMDATFDAASDILLKYRIKKMKSHLHNHNKVEEYMKNHVRNLEWHLSRIYHYRNELVHEAAIKQSIDGVTNNLRSYLVFMLNLLLDYCSLQMQSPQGTTVGMDNFFWHYELLWKKFTPEFEKEGFLSLKMPDNIVR